jgi:hypothetical protein
VKSKLALIVCVVFSLVSEEALAAYPGDNGKIAFSYLQGNSEEIYTVDPDGTNRVRLGWEWSDEVDQQLAHDRSSSKLVAFRFPDRFRKLP